LGCARDRRDPRGWQVEMDHMTFVGLHGINEEVSASSPLNSFGEFEAAGTPVVQCVNR
jgi:hypothetical protein